jgi:hypothetical protein
VDTGFPKGNATTIESRALSGHDPHDFLANLIGKRSKFHSAAIGLLWVDNALVHRGGYCSELL